MNNDENSTLCSLLLCVLSIDCYIMSTAIATVVTIAEILKNNGLAVEKSETSILLHFFLSSFLTSAFYLAYN